MGVVWSSSRVQPFISMPWMDGFCDMFTTYPNDTWACSQSSTYFYRLAATAKLNHRTIVLFRFVHRKQL
jgi:hypothetical protein